MANSIRRFVRTTRLWNRLFHAGASTATHGLGVAVVWGVVGFSWPAWNQLAFWVGCGWLSLVAAFYLVRRMASVEVTDRTLGLRDRLATWWQVRGDREDAMLRWLEGDLERSLAGLPRERRSVLWRRQSRRLWWLLPLLFIVYWIGPFGDRLLMESDAGLTEVTSRGPERSSDTGDGPGGQTPGTDGEDPQPSATEPEPKKPDPKNGEEPDSPEAPKPKPPKAIPELPNKDEFVIPQFVGSGAGKKQRMKVAVREIDDTTSPQRRTTQPTAADPKAVPLPEFRAAAERARRARHVPPGERPFVTRYFQELLEGRR